ncbi:uncharacterized protein LOC133805919 [Humulus lupulus]|uniref:uncharacterized protein LOC133805919 n=1 Tax=Humulus lupulus TaxID=3486 RepID=UPI002B404133|nr:uncharacterized protein LOC133805919 [Humulus lupulus]
MQSTFVKGRIIQDNSMVVQEILHSVRSKRTKEGHLLIKLDMEKAYGRLDWNVLKTVLSRLGFHKNFVGWIMKCVTTSSFTLLLNGGKVGSITPTRGLRQGDPLSPTLFIIATDVIFCLLMRDERNKNLKGFKVIRHVTSISHLLFVDDIVLCGKATLKETKALMGCLDKFYTWSGEKISKLKLSVFFSNCVPQSTRMDLTDILQMPRVKNDCLHLGLPLLMSRSRSRDMSFILNRVNSRVQGWKTKLLSKAGRSTLVQLVGSSLISYVAASGPLPHSIQESVNRAMRYSDSRNWKCIVKVATLLKQGLYRRIGNGRKTSIWFDSWLPSQPHRPTPLLDASHGISWVESKKAEEGHFYLGNILCKFGFAEFAPVTGMNFGNTPSPDELREHLSSDRIIHEYFDGDLQRLKRVEEG